MSAVLCLRRNTVILGTLVILGIAGAAAPASMAAEKAVQSGHSNRSPLAYSDIFDLEYAVNPDVSPDGKTVIYERRSHDVMTDTTRINIWTVGLDGRNHRPLLSGKAQYRMPRFSPDGTRVAYISSAEGRPQLYVRWLDSGQTARVTNLQHAPGNISWSPDSRQLAFTMFVPSKAKRLFQLPPRPKGAKWAGDAKVIDRAQYRVDGAGYLPRGFRHIFTVPADGGTPHQVTHGYFNHTSTLHWMPDGKSLVFAANRTADVEAGIAGEPRESEIYRLNLKSGALTALTNRAGPDTSPQVSPDGDYIAYTGFDEDGMSSPSVDLYVMKADGSGGRRLTAGLDREVADPQWAKNGKGLYYTYDDRGSRTVAYISLAGKSRSITRQLGGTSLGRPYTSGGYKVATGGRLVFTLGRPDRPADLAVTDKKGKLRQLTRLNEDLLGHRALATVQEINYKSSVDGRDLQAWVALPPGFDAAKTYPLILEIHGGPHTAYGPHFSTEVQMYAAKGYAVLYGNPRGSTSYGADFANLIHQNYPSHDFDDLMDGVDHVLAAGYVDADQLYVTGGSGGGVLTAWIVGNTDRFRAAVVAKPVINWTSFVLTADFSAFFTKYWFADMPWNTPEAYWQRSPLSLVGSVNTPTMLLTGEEDYRTPISETEQYYQALKLRGVDTAMVRIPGSGHGIAAKPSNLIQKIGNILAWFETHKTDKKDKEGK